MTTDSPPATPPIKAAVVDMDGVLWRESEALPGLKDFFSFFESHSFPYILATNNATQSSLSYAQRLENLGVQVDADRILTSGLAACLLMPEHCPPPGPLYIIGSDDLQLLFTQGGYDLTLQAREARAVVVGFDRQLTWHKLAEAALAINAGAFFMGTNPDPSFPSERGLVPGNGAQLAALTAATGVEPYIVGKPEPTIYELAMKKLGTKGTETLAIGDRLETDILGGTRAGLQTALLLTGVSTRAAVADSPTQPDYIFENLIDLIAFLEDQRQP